LIDFFDVSYLANGTPIQRRGYKAINSSGILRTLKEFDPVVVGTLPLDLFTDESDIDIICCCSDAERLPDLSFKSKTLNGVLSFISNFNLLGFKFEVVAQPIPVREQLAFRHMVAEWKILSGRDEMFRQRILELKRSGIKTEPAFAQLMGLQGNPYEELLQYS
jgi:hypothetical protein